MSDERNLTVVQKLKEAFRSFQWSSLAPVILLIGIVSLLAAAVMRLIRWDAGFESYVYIPLAIGVLCVLSFGLLDPQRLQSWLGSRQMRYGLNVLIMTIALLGILVAVNYIVYRLAERQTLWVDLTEDKSNSLAPETLRTLQVLSGPVEARAYFTASSYSWESTLTLLDKYKSSSGGKFTYQRIDPDANPVMAEKDKVSADATIILAAGERTEIVTTLSEQQLTTALIRLENPGENIVYFLTGHGEAKTDATGDGDISQVATALKAKSYKTETLDLRESGSVPEGAKALIIVGPKQPLLSTELTAVKDFLAAGGSLILMENPYPLTRMTPETDILAQYLASDWGVTFQNDIIIDTITGVPLIAIASGGEASTITGTISSYIIFPSVQSILLKPDSNGNLTQSHLVTVGDMGQGTWGEMDIAQIGDFTMAESTTATFDPAVDHAPPLTVAITAENTATGARMVVFGDEDFAENQYVTAYSNRDLLTNAIDWATRQEKLIELTPRQTTNRILLPPEVWVKNAIIVTSAILLPACFLVVGLIVWYFRRQHK
jgi:ABC-type uncharacterized transport system involved in gliding motility auxiliary subunit